MKKLTIGQWAEDNGSQLRNVANWRVARDDRGTHAEIVMRILVLRNSLAIAELNAGVVLRGSDEDHAATWETGSREADDARALCAKAESMDTAGIAVHHFRGFSYALPWEIHNKAKRTVWSRVKRLLHIS